MKKIFFTVITFFTLAVLSAQSHFSSQSHNDKITNVTNFPSKDGYDISFLTAGADGFLVKWTEDDLGEHYQISDVGIKLAVCSPNGRDIAVYETDGGSVNKVTVWDWTKLTKKYTKKFNDSVTSLTFSKKGTYLIIGLATVDGNTFVRTSDWSTVNKIKENTSIVNYITTSDTEKTVVMYSPTGTLSYYDMATGKIKQKFQCIAGMDQVRMFNNNLFLAGIKDNNLHIIRAISGKSVSSIPINKAVILSNEDETNLYYLEYDGKNNYDLKMLESIDNKTVSNPRIVKNMKGPRGNGAITTGCKMGDTILLGSGNGTVYKTSSEATVITETLQSITENVYSQILDIAECGDSFYFLTESNIFKSSYDSGIVSKITSTNGQTNMETFEENIVLYSRDTKNPVTMINLTSDTKTDIFTPKNNIQNISVFGNKIIEIESSAYVNLFDGDDGSYKQIYSGSGVQDAVYCDDGNVYIAKSASTNPASPLVMVNPKTLETVPLSVKGRVTYGLSTNGKTIYGINLQSTDTGSVTYVFAFNPVSKVVTNLLKFSEEDSEAFTYLSDNYLYTNIGKNKVYSYNINDKKRFSYDRTASMPKKVCKNERRVAILNCDGSISWASSSSNSLLADWYLTIDDQWYEF